MSRSFEEELEEARELLSHIRAPYLMKDLLHRYREIAQMPGDNSPRVRAKLQAAEERLKELLEELH